MTTPTALLGCLLAGVSAAPPQPLLPIPTPQQLAWQDMEFGMFCHFGVNTFTNREWGDGTEDPNIFNPSALDARQWVTTARDVGMKYLIVTAKHHDGFCLFPSAYTGHSVKSSAWRGGKGDVVKEVAGACHDLGIVFGFYLSPWDRHEPKYEDSAAYDEHFKNQLRELLTGYGKAGEVWFDGAGSEGHKYDWAGYYALIRELQPGALIAICGPDIRWVGNEEGVAPETLWNVVDRDGEKVWHPAECDVPVRKGHWFFAADSEDSVRSVSEVLDIYYKSVGRGAVLLLNVTPDTRGLLPDKDVGVLREVRRILDSTFATDLAQGKPATADAVRGNDPAYGPGKALDGDPATYWATDDGVTTGTIEVDLGSPVAFNRAMIRENVALGQRVEEYAIEAWDGSQWNEVVRGTTIGHKRLDRFDDTTATKVRFVIRKALACPAISGFGLYRATEE